MSEQCQPLPWETSFFGVKIAQVNTNHLLIFGIINGSSTVLETIMVVYKRILRANHKL